MRKSYFLLLILSLLFSFSAIAKEKTEKIVRPKPIPPRILMIGDSHSVGIFGHKLTDLIKTTAPKIELMAVASCGSEPHWWLTGKSTHCGLRTLYPNGFDNTIHNAPTPKLADLFNLTKPKMTIVQLGSNLVLLTKQERETYTQAMMNIIQQNGGQCIWISAPASRKFSSADLHDVYEVLKTVTKKTHCKLIDSRKYTKYPNTGGDGLHYGGQEGGLIATHWAEKVFVSGIKPTLEKTFKLTPEKKELKIKAKEPKSQTIKKSKNEIKTLKTNLSKPKIPAEKNHVHDKRK